MQILFRKPGSGRPTHADGNIFSVTHDGTIKESPSKNSNFWLIVFCGANVEDYHHLEDMVEVDTPANELPFVDSSINMIGKKRDLSIKHRRQWYIDVDSLPAWAIDELEVKRAAWLPNTIDPMEIIKSKI